LGDETKMNNMGGACSTYGRQEMRIQNYLWEDLRERLRGRPRRRWEDNIKMGLKEAE